MLKRTLPLFALLTSFSACRHQSGQAQDLPDGRVKLETEAVEPLPAAQLTDPPLGDKEFNPLAPIKIETDSSALAKLWREGAAAELKIREVKIFSCDPPQSDACSDEEEWLVSKASRKVKHVSCRCGKTEEKQTVLSAAAFAALDQKINALQTDANPAPCSSDAPDVSLLLTSGESQVTFPVDYGQCGGGVAPRISLETFESLITQLNQITF